MDPLETPITLPIRTVTEIRLELERSLALAELLERLRVGLRALSSPFVGSIDSFLRDRADRARLMRVIRDLELAVRAQTPDIDVTFDDPEQTPRVVLAKEPRKVTPPPVPRKKV